MGATSGMDADDLDGPLDEFPDRQRDLTLESVPSPDAPWYPDIADFALTFNGYEALGGMGPLAETANRVQSEWTLENDKLPDDLVELRSCLFFEQRRDHFGQGPDERDMPYLRTLVAAIRQRVVNRSSKGDGP